jgi:hypothetical protein
MGHRLKIESSPFLTRSTTESRAQAPFPASSNWTMKQSLGTPPRTSLRLLLSLLTRATIFFAMNGVNPTLSIRLPTVLFRHLSTPPLVPTIANQTISIRSTLMPFRVSTRFPHLAPRVSKTTLRPRGPTRRLRVLPTPYSTKSKMAQGRLFSRRGPTLLLRTSRSRSSGGRARILPNPMPTVTPSTTSEPRSFLYGDIT